MPSSSNNINNKREDDLQTKRCSPPLLSSTRPTRQKPRQQLFLQLCSNTLPFLSQREDEGCSLQLVFPFLEPKTIKTMKKMPPEKQIICTETALLLWARLLPAALSSAQSQLCSPQSWEGMGSSGRGTEMPCWSWQLS